MLDLSDIAVVPSIVLNMQYRMQPDISYFPNEHFYESKLEDAALVRMRAALDGMATHPLLGTRHVAFLDHEGASVFEDKSIANYEEVDVVVALVADLVRRLPRVRGHQIGIVSPYARQTRLFERAFSDLAAGRRTDLLASGKDADRVRGIQCATVDGYQGREKDFIVFATSRSKPKYGSNLGFLADPRRLCVACVGSPVCSADAVQAHTRSSRPVHRRQCGDAERRAHATGRGRGRHRRGRSCADHRRAAPAGHLVGPHRLAPEREARMALGCRPAAPRRRRCSLASVDCTLTTCRYATVHSSRVDRSEQSESVGRRGDTAWHVERRRRVEKAPALESLALLRQALQIEHLENLAACQVQSETGQPRRPMARPAPARGSRERT